MATITSTIQNGDKMNNSGHSLAHGLKQRHITMLSIGGVIGAGLFVGSGHAIAEAGPAAPLAYMFAGLLVLLVMRMLGEMAAASPDTGSFSTYADRAIGRWAGFSIGWLYWWFWVLDKCGTRGRSHRTASRLALQRDPLDPRPWEY